MNLKKYSLMLAGLILLFIPGVAVWILAILLKLVILYLLTLGMYRLTVKTLGLIAKTGKFAGGMIFLAMAGYFAGILLKAILL